jgi:CBS domain containing-hemolysin-like protein
MPSDPSSELCRREKKLSWFKRLKHSLISFLRSEESFEESLTELIEEHESYGNKVSHEEKEMLQNIINYGDLKVNDVMVPRSEVKALPDTATLDDFKELLLKKNHTRIPIYHENLDNVKGFVNVKDLLPWIYRKDQLKWDIDKLIREIFIVSPSMKLIDLLVKMKQSRIHIAIIVDEYGCTDGLVTFEDLVEEIVGEIEDEFDENKDSDMIKIREDVFVVNAREDIEKIEDKIDDEEKAKQKLE